MTSNILRNADSCIYIYPGVSGSTLPPLPCLCSSLRRTSRAITQRYEEALRPLGLRATQFTILQVLARAGELSQGRLGEILAMDVTTLTRTLDTMRRKGWLEAHRGQDRRWRFWRLAKRGQAQLRLAEPAWETVQSQVREQLGKQDWDAFLRLSNQIAGVLENQGDQV